MDSFSAVIDEIGGTTALATVLGIPDSHARTMKARDSIPLEYWSALVKAASAAGKDAINYETLAALAARRRRLPEASAVTGSAA